jgi:hypothetical protein
MNRVFLGPAVLVCALGALAAQGGIIDIEMLEYKGTVVIQPGFWQKQYLSHMTVTLGQEWENPGTYHRDNRETLTWVNAGPAIALTFYNFYATQIEVPEPPWHDELVDFYWLMAVGDSPTQLTPLPDGMALTAASLIGGTGTEYQGTITPLSNLASLPTSSSHDTSITWDLSPFAQTTGNFYLASVTMPAHEAVPEPASLLLLGLVVLARRR